MRAVRFGRGMRAATFVAASLLGTTVLGACGSDAAPEARICDGTADLRTGLAELVEAVTAGDDGAARDAEQRTREAFKDIADARDDLASEQREAFDAALAQLGTALALVPQGEAVTADGAAAAVDGARDAVEAALDGVGGVAGCQ
jgi:hypothetical protein